MPHGPKAYPVLPILGAGLILCTRFETLPMRKYFAALIVTLALSACSHPAPPAGRWEGTYETNDTMIVARVEVTADGQVRVSAPDLLNIGGSSDEDRKAMRQQLADGLAGGWGTVAARPFDFDGHTFRKPGGIAPQMYWDADKKQMTLVVYLGVQPAIDIPLHQVDDFSDNPWFS
jgi:hypothetical protein